MLIEKNSLIRVIGLLLLFNFIFLFLCLNLGNKIKKKRFQMSNKKIALLITIQILLLAAFLVLNYIDYMSSNQNNIESKNPLTDHSRYVPFDQFILRSMILLIIPVANLIIIYRMRKSLKVPAAKE